MLARFDDGDVKVADDAPMSFLVIRTERETWGPRFLLSGTRRVNVEHEPYWVTVAISGHGFEPFIPVIFNEIRFHVIFPLILLSLMFLLFNFSVVRSTLKPLRTTIAAVDRIDPAQVATRIEPEVSSRETQALVSSVNRLLERVERSVGALKEFAGDAAHELRTPLAIMLLSIGKLPQSLEKSKLIADAQAMRRLVDQMLDLSYATALEIDAHTCADLSAVAADAAMELTPLAVARGRSIVFRDAGAAVVPGHAEAIGRALRNLIENQWRIRSRELKSRSWPDRARNAPSAIMVRAFPRIDAASCWNASGGSTTAARKGQELGLAIAPTIMQLHGGRIEIEDAPGGGALIRLVFDKENRRKSSPRD